MAGESAAAFSPHSLPRRQMPRGIAPNRIFSEYRSRLGFIALQRGLNAVAGVEWLITHCVRVVVISPVCVYQSRTSLAPSAAKRRPSSAPNPATVLRVLVDGRPLPRFDRFIPTGRGAASPDDADQPATSGGTVAQRRQRHV